MADPINLRQFRKRKQRELKEDQAQTNREQFGISKNTRQQAKNVEAVTQQKFAGKKRTLREEN